MRRAGLAAISQADVMTAVNGTDRSNWRDGVGFFLPGTPMASDAGMAALKEPPDRDAARRILASSSYGGETLVFMSPADFPSINAECEVVADALQKVGFKIGLQSMDWGTLQSRAAKQAPVAQGGWHVTGSFTAGAGLLNPAANNFLRGSGKSAIFGWPDIPQLEALREAWFRAPDEATQARAVPADTGAGVSDRTIRAHGSAVWPHRLSPRPHRRAARHAAVLRHPPRMTTARPGFHFPEGGDFLLLPPTQQAHAYRSVDRMFATRTVARGEVVHDLPAWGGNRAALPGRWCRVRRGRLHATRQRCRAAGYPRRRDRARTLCAGS